MDSVCLLNGGTGSEVSGGIAVLLASKSVCSIIKMYG